jgi:two-component system, response regulator PdtaR
MMDKVLIVEDDEIIQKLIEYRLHALGYTVCGKADTGEGAIFSAMHTKPDVILMDINLKGTVDGIDAAKIIRKSLSPSIIFLTAFTDDSIIQRVKEVHPEGFIEKPFNDTDLRVALTLAHNDTSPALSPPSIT